MFRGWQLIDVIWSNLSARAGVYTKWHLLEGNEVKFLRLFTYSSTVNNLTKKSTIVGLIDFGKIWEYKLHRVYSIKRVFKTVDVILLDLAILIDSQTSDSSSTNIK